MGITFNRKPETVNIPSSADAQNKFFNHYNWKGINQNRNFLLVDQETFADAKNVYVDDEGLLKSRLSLKFKHRFSNKDIKDVKVFDNIILCTYIGSDGEWYIGIIEDEVWAVDYKIFADYPLKAFKNGNYLYIFTNQGSITYNSETKTISDTLFYDAVTRIYTSLNFDFYESENLMSSKNRYRYMLYPTKNGDWISDSINSNAYGKTGSYIHYIDEEKLSHTIKIDENNRFLNVVHQPLFTSVDGFYIENIFHVEVPTWVIRNETIYRFFNNKIQMANVSDGLFIDLFKLQELLPDEDEIEDIEFVKIKLTGIGRIYIITNKYLFIIDMDNTITYSSQASSETVCDIDEQSYNGEIVQSRLLLRDGILLARVPRIVYKIEGNNNVTYEYISLNVGLPLTYIEYAAVPLQTDMAMDTLLKVFIVYHCSKCSDFVYIDLVEGYFDYYFIGSMNYDVVDNVGEGIFKGIEVEQTDTDEGNIKMVPSIRIVRDRTSLEVCCFDTFVGDIEYGLISYPTTVGNPGEDTDVKFNFAEDYNAGTYESYNYCGGLFITPNNDSFPLEYVYGNLKQSVTTLRGKFFVSGNYWMLHTSGVTMSNYRLKEQNIDISISKTPKLTDFDIIVKKDKFYVSKGNNFYIGEIIIDTDDDQEKLYFKKEYQHVLDENITGLHSISDTELAIFTHDNTWYNVEADGVYYYRQSKIVPNLKNNSELITLPDSTTTLMPSNDGIIALSYQNFVNTTEQSTVNLTQDLTAIYDLFNNSICIVNWKQYTLFYENGNKYIFIYDNRLASWWLWELPVKLSTLFIYNSLLYGLSNGAFYEFIDLSNAYFDELENENLDIDWHIESQKLHLGANNHYKHISNITLFSVQEADKEKGISLNLNVKNYRKWVDNGKAENFDYKIDVIRTYIKRLNYAKVCEFQYRLSSDNTNAVNVPLALSNITIKYKIGGQVR